MVDDRWEWSDALYHLHGYLPREIPATTHALMSHKHPDDRERVAGVFAAAVRDGETYTCYHRIIDRNQQVLSVVSVGTTRLDPDGRTTGVEGYYIDLTAARREESEVDVRDALARKARNGPIIEQAKGMIMLAEGCTADEAFDRLRTCSAHANRKVGDLARDLVESLATSSPDSGLVSEVLGQLVDAARTAPVAETGPGASA
ncbi:PAS and ANTAR domain-containing protein [Nocardioides furvisabuli]|uniref:PAS and ANTAR domain-containing protein n=1 Tax=Nocardioides furvisabuli TaxID=375542 RepID=UPI001E35F701|nr:PAS and ANTAR domain-containing protein [Nocardioides furvisabuli]